MNARNLIARCFAASEKESSVHSENKELSSLLITINLPTLNLLQLSQIKGGVGGQSSESDIEVVELLD